MAENEKAPLSVGVATIGESSRTAIGLVHGEK